MRRSLPDPALTAAALEGGQAELDALVRAWLPLVYAWSHRLGGPGVDAEGAAHETVLTMCRRLDRVRAPEVLPSWLFGICRRTIANHRRRAWLRRWVPGASTERAWTGAGPERDAEAQQVADAVWKVLDGLPAAQREVLILCELEERSGSEAAALLGIPLGTVKSRLRAASRAFRAAFPEADPLVAEVS
ncbi:MAG: sigma-70 family RNA polymerase sigma factor [Myxococcota bacterium]